ncbi:hypothetical protein [Candidatus Scalindua japonica]|uniref:hypothetical protein n=1 Tax=Candidatus Scalindua japonica TaxID=1284222 RepID=UPI001054D135|nr:hypothetical protein [Candidatus Scalindua japonica]
MDDVDGVIGTLTSVGVSNTADASLGDGLISYTGAAGSFAVNFTAGASKPVIGPQQIDLVDLSITGAAGSLVLGLTDTGFIGSGIPSSITDAIGGTTVGTVLASGHYDPANVEFGLGAIPASLGPFVAPTQGTVEPFSGSASAAVAAHAGLFSLTKFVTITHTTGGATSFNNSLSVPEPGLALLLGISLVGLVGVGATRRFKGAKKE